MELNEGMGEILVRSDTRQSFCDPKANTLPSSEDLCEEDRISCGGGGGGDVNL